MTREYKYSYSINFMGPINYAWIQEHGEHWAGGRIDVHGGDEDYALSLPLMHADDFSELSKWLGSLTTEHLWSVEEITALFERETSTKIRWFEAPKWEKNNGD